MYQTEENDNYNIKISPAKQITSIEANECNISSKQAPNKGLMSPFSVKHARHILSNCKGAVK